MVKPLIEVYAREGCCLCKEAMGVIGKVRNDIPFQFKEIDIASSEELLRMYNDNVPTVFINGKKAFKYRVDEDEFRKKVRKEIIKAGISRIMDKNKPRTE